MEGLNAHHWDEDEREKLQHTMDTSTQTMFCGVDEVGLDTHNSLKACFLLL